MKIAIAADNLADKLWDVFRKENPSTMVALMAALSFMHQILEECVEVSDNAGGIPQISNAVDSIDALVEAISASPIIGMETEHLPTSETIQ